MTTFMAGWLTVFLVGCLAVMSPGPNMAMVLKNSLAHSRRAGVRTAAGLALGDAVHVSYCLVGIAVVISRSILLFDAIKWVGAAYLVYVGVRSLRARRHVPDEENAIRNAPPEAMGALAAVRSGFFTSLLNPKVTLFFLALFTQVVRPETPLLAKAVYGLTVVGIEFGWFALVALLVSTGTVKRRFDAVSHWIERATGRSWPPWASGWHSRRPAVDPARDSGGTWGACLVFFTLLSLTECGRVSKVAARSS